MVFDNDTVTMTMDEYRELEDDRLRLQCLREAGVDNWDGYDEAMDLLSSRI